MDNNQNDNQLFSNYDNVFQNANLSVKPNNQQVNSQINAPIEVKPVVPQQIINSNSVVNSSNNVNNQYNINRVEEIKQKENNVSPVTYTDGIDEDINYNKGIRGFFTNRKVITVTLVLAFVAVCVVVAKAFYFGKKVDEYEDFFIEVDKKLDEEARAYAGQKLDNVTLKKVAASELVSCIK